jgi:hypothetical protein
MPKDLYKWEDAGALIHHCPICHAPLTKLKARSTCLGEHVEWCKRYHPQLFKIGCGAQCFGCHSSEEESRKRYKDIADTVHRMKELGPEPVPRAAPATPTSERKKSKGQAFDFEQLSGKQKKEKKQVKDLQKMSERKKGLTNSDIESVATILESQIRRRRNATAVTNYEQIKDNLSFHKGSADVKATRTAMKQERTASNASEVAHIAPATIDGVLQLLDIAPLDKSTAPEGKFLVTELRKKVRDTLVKMHQEADEIEMRRGGFWRWASKKAFKRLQDNGGIWHKDGGALLDEVKAEGEAVNEDAEDSTENNDMETGTDDSDSAESESQPATPEDDATAGAFAYTISELVKEPATPDAIVDDGWTTVATKSGRATPMPKPTLAKITLVHNKGLEKIAQSPSPRTPKLDLAKSFGGEYGAN